MSTGDAYEAWLEGHEGRVSVFGEELLKHQYFAEPFTVSPDATVAQAIDLMNDNRVGCVLVCVKEHVEGIFTERDVLRRVIGKLDAASTPVSAVMTPRPETVDENERLTVGLNLMINGGFRHLPVLRAGRPIGVFSMRHGMRVFCEIFQHEIQNAPPPGQEFGDVKPEGA